MHTTNLPIIKSPTEETYGEFHGAFNHFNHSFFDGKLPFCLITLHRVPKRAYGYFAPKRFVRLNDETAITDEIALNPKYFAARSIEKVLSTLVHEMVHMWQAHFGKASRTGYHNSQWAQKMEEVGLIPSDTAAPGGKRTGQRVSHYIEKNGAFERATSQLLESGFSISWADALSLMLLPPKPGKGGRRVKFACPECGAAAWGKGALRLICGDCELPMQLIV